MFDKTSNIESDNSMDVKDFLPVLINITPKTSKNTKRVGKNFRI